jgi:cytochrome c oxidase subunit 3
MFAGLTSAYMVRHAQGNWVTYKLPIIFWISTVVIILGSVAIQMSVRSFKQHNIPRYRTQLMATLVLGLLFGICQYVGFKQLYANNIRIDGNPSESFLFVIFGLHLAHIAGGIIALIVHFIRAYRTKIKVYSATGLEVIAGYWHFVGILWIYLFVFFLANQ